MSYTHFVKATPITAHAHYNLIIVFAVGKHVGLTVTSNDITLYEKLVTF